MPHVIVSFALVLSPLLDILKIDRVQNRCLLDFCMHTGTVTLVTDDGMDGGRYSQSDHQLEAYESPYYTARAQIRCPVSDEKLSFDLCS